MTYAGSVPTNIVSWASFTVEYRWSFSEQFHEWSIPRRRAQEILDGQRNDKGEDELAPQTDFLKLDLKLS